MWRGEMRVAMLFVLAAYMCSAMHLSGEGVSSGMHLAISKPQEDPSVDQMIDLHASPDSLSMKASSAPDEDMQGEDGQMMAFHSEDALDIGGSGEAMQLSGPALPTVTAEDRKFDVEEDVQVSEDMVEGASALAGVIDAREEKLADYRQMIEASKNNAEQQSRDAKRLIQDAYSKQAYLQNLQKQVLEQSVSLESQKQSLAQRETELQALKQRLEAEASNIHEQSNLQTAQGGVSGAIETQMAELQTKQHAFEQETAAKEQKLKAMEENLMQLKHSVDEKDGSLTQKQADVEKMYAQLSELSKSAQTHAEQVKQEEAALRQQEAMAAKQAALEAKVNELTSKLTQMRQDEIAGTQNALQTEVALDKSLAELDPQAKQELGVPEDYSVEHQIAQQPPVQFTRTAVLVVPESPPPSTEHPDLVDRSSRDVETRLDERPPTYGQKLLVGQAYSAKFEPKPDGDMRDHDGHCRNSRGDVMPCDLYDLKTGGLPPVIPSVGDLLDGDYYTESGPCVLKCGYHKGVGRALQYVSVEIPTKTAHNQTIACPKTNNGFPFVTCQLLVDDTEQCRSTCVFDGSANPLKPKMMGLDGTHLSAEDFRSLAHTTYVKETSNGCASRMAADPLVACEVRL